MTPVRDDRYNRSKKGRARLKKFESSAERRLYKASYAKATRKGLSGDARRAYVRKAIKKAQKKA